MLGDQIRQLRIAYGMNQVQLSKILNVSKQAVSNWENNNILPSVDMLISIADYFSVSTDYLLDRDNHLYLDTNGLTEAQRSLIQRLVDELSASNREEKEMIEMP